MKLKFPYGYSDFEKIINQNYLFIDRTDHIRLLEETGDNILFLRPRRFGKSLFLSILENYYDVAKADRFEALFGQLAIGQNPTANRNQYFVMKWDFSMIDPQGDVDKIKGSLYDHINSCIIDFSDYYQPYIKRKIEIDRGNAIYSFRSLLTAVRGASHRLYLLVDEYDNFANEVMVSREQGQQRYEALIQGEGIFKTLFKVIKGTLAGMGVERVFMTGVSPVVMSDLTSGQFVADNIYFKPEFNDLCGFREDEVVEMLEQVATHCHISKQKTDETMSMMRRFYDGYTFTNHHPVYRPDSPSTQANQPERIYNPNMVLYFLKYLQAYCE